MPIREANKKSDGLPRKSSTAWELDELGNDLDFNKMKVECICPKCGNKHIMNFHWIGRGTPRKFCSLCKNSHD